VDNKIDNKGDKSGAGWKILTAVLISLAAVVWAITTLFEIEAAKSLAILILVLFSTVIVCLVLGISPLG
jgi:antibiotic biosynthesis monooxygenase (ABM) superfamily enzyme